MRECRRAEGEYRKGRRGIEEREDRSTGKGVEEYRRGRIEVQEKE
jgi:hypothetical protein